MNFDGKITARQTYDVFPEDDPRRYFVRIEGQVNNTSVEFNIYGADAQGMMGLDMGTLFTVSLTQKT